MVQNVESLAHAALIARFGVDWYRSLGRGETRGTALVTVLGRTSPGVVLEIEMGTSLREVAASLGEDVWSSEAILLGGYFGGWCRVDEVIDRRLDPVDVADVGSSFGCGLIALLPQGSCGVRATASILRLMANESARQCGPCLFGLAAIADAAERLAALSGGRNDVANLVRWAAMVRGRGACHHPDGAAGLLESALRAFGTEYRLHGERRCSLPGRQQQAA
jgi:NADH:ubiquinone oxidoreductase subunit F (NADH-binding)